MKIDTIEAVASLIVTTAGVAVITTDTETKLLAFCIIGAALGGIVAVGSTTGENPITKKQRGTRWLTNFAGGIFTGPFSADWALRHWIPDANPTYVALAAGGLCGFAAVAVLCIAGPATIQWIRNKISPESKLP